MLQQPETHAEIGTHAPQAPLEMAIRRSVIPAIIARHSLPGEIEALVEALLAGGDGQAELRSARARGDDFSTISLSLLTPAARSLNTYWEEDRGSFATVTLAVWRLRSLMRDLAAEMPAQPSASPTMRGILVSTLPGEQHDFGVAMVSEFFSRGGWAATHLRPATMDDLVADLQASGPELLGLSIARTDALPLLRQTIAAIRRAMRRQSPAIMIGGAALLIDPEIVARSGADGHSACASTALAEAARLLEQRAGAFPSSPPRKDRFVGLPNSRRGVSGAGTTDHRAASRGRS